MSHSKETTNIKLPLYERTDKFDPLNDCNSQNKKIDAAYWELSERIRVLEEKIEDLENNG